jgi:hypothetical protein
MHFPLAVIFGRHNMTRWKRNIQNKIRNIKLLPESDESFCSFISNIQLEYFHLRKSNQRRQADIIANPLEKTVREWAKLSGATIKERIISYELLQNSNKYEKRFNELDCIFLLDNKYYLVEVKVSSSTRAIPKASNQLKNAYQILCQAKYDVALLIIHINLNYKNVESTYHQFNEEFLKSDFTELYEYDLPLFYLQLKPQEIFKWGVENGIILDTELLSKAIEESDELHLNRLARQELIDKQIPQEQWPPELKREMKLEDEETHIKSFGDSSSPSLLAEKLKEAFKNKK